MDNLVPRRASRRIFLGQAALIAQAALFGNAIGSTLLQAMPEDEDLFRDAMLWAKGERLSARPIGDVITAFGEHFLGTPYVGHTLEAPGDEHLVINLREFDCMTFVENMLTLAQCAKKADPGFDVFQKQLTSVRYRNGVIDGYPSRLHYFSDWIRDNVRKGIVQDMSRELGGSAYRKPILFMSGHFESYRQLDNSAFVQRIKAVESTLSALTHYYIPAARIAKIQDRLQNGDIIGTTTAMEGMDVSHTGLVIRQGDVVRFMHAPLSGKKVLISTGSLAEYVTGIRTHTGIVVARPVEPK